MMIQLTSLLVIFAVLVSFGHSVPDTKAIKVASNDEVIDLIKTKPYLLVLFYGERCDKTCQEVKGELELVMDGSLINDLQVVAHEGKLVADSYGIKKYPSVLFFRSAYPVIYPAPLIEAADIVPWMQQNRMVATQVLVDSNFEHLTQASTGATTGDWFVMFYGPSCNELTATWEALATELKHRMNVAKVDSSNNLGLKNRFSITKCPTLIFFRAGKMYRYDLPDMEFNRLLSFANGFYKNVQAEKVATEPSPFDVLTASIADGIKEKVDGPHGTYYVVGVFIIVFVVLLSVVLYCTRPDDRDKLD